MRERRAGAHLLDALDVVDRGGGGKALAIARGKGCGIAAVERDRPRSSPSAADERLLEPSAQLRAASASSRSSAARSISARARRRAQDEMHARQHRLVELRRRSCRPCRDRPSRGSRRSAGATRCRSGRAAHRRSSETNRPKGSRRTNSATRWRSCRPRMPMRDVEQLVLGDLEQLVARKALEDVRQRLAVMARGLEAARARRRARPCGAAAGWRAGSWL